MRRRISNENLKRLCKILKGLTWILRVLDATVVLNILYYAIITPSSFEFDKIVPKFIKIYNLGVGFFNIFYFLLIIIIYIILKRVYKVKIRKNTK
ncbi:hypothetical protein HMPREF1092_03266 [Clostridium thermobutyricum]|uniref:Uncharacterized protein n=1 Tax=Clostridium thermobutyricum TaxID=29372 RepID=N9XT70_9CLOT|nr:hypothetical protein [Clostridium thermobutyricum]ENY98786.1 hypothetical protein HMPREF1092_03266 [Clostridium thermobutyricum]